VEERCHVIRGVQDIKYRRNDQFIGTTTQYPVPITLPPNHQNFYTMRFTGVASMAALAAVLLPACGAVPLGNVSPFTTKSLAVYLTDIHTESPVSRWGAREAY
jgi:hypothetical protein